MNSLEKLTHLQQLLKTEKEEDLRQYKVSVLDRSLTDRIKKGITWYPSLMKRMYIGMGERLVVELEQPSSQKKEKAFTSFQSGGVVSIFGKLSDQEVGRLTGVISSIRQGTMKIALSTEKIPDWLTHSQLGVDQEFDDKTYQEMNRALSQVINAKKQDRLGELREILLGEVSPSFRKWEVGYNNPALNKIQNDAVENALEARDVAIIHGPPGTGKTTTIVQVIKELTHHEHQLLVCAPSNTAVDLLTLKCIEEGLAVVRMGNPARVEDSLLQNTLDGWIAEHQDYAALRKLRKEAEKVRQQAHKYKRNFGPQERQRRKELSQEARELKKLAHQLEAYIIHQVIHRAQVITTTLTGAAHSLLADKRFHTVLIDEAGQALSPACWIPILRADRVIMAGDHCQLPPTVKSIEAARSGLDKTLFEEIAENKNVDVMLQDQYRMNEQIMKFSGREFYQDQLVAAPSVKYHQLGPEFSPVEFIDTAGCGCEEIKNTETQSLANPEEGYIVLKHLALLINQITTEVPEILEEPFSIGIIAPYKEQVRKLKDLLHSSPMLSDYERYITINTVDGFQGQERDIVYISMVRSNGKGEIGFLKNIRRMNVALTRARKKLVVVGDSATLGNHSFYSHFLDYVDEIGAYRSAWEYVNQDQ